jgi:hypothetical protein
MNMEMVFHPEKRTNRLYPNLPAESVREAKLYLNLLKEGAVKSAFMDKSDAERELAKIAEGTLSESVVEGHANNYYFYLHPEEQQ